jgi:enoyl-CoA hydratase
MTEQSNPAEGRITTELSDGLFLIGIDRAAKLNGFTPVMLRGMAQAYTRYENEPEARCAVVFAEGANFTAGLDLPKVAPYLPSWSKRARSIRSACGLRTAPSR